MAAIVIVYDSVFGNTAQVARAIGAELEAAHQVRCIAVTEAGSADLAGADLLIFGSPTRGFRPTPAIQEFIGSAREALRGVPAVAFDTRLDPESIHPAPLRWVVQAGGYAAQNLQRELAEYGAVKIAEPEGFLVGGTEGPLLTGELARARDWARGVAARLAVGHAA